MILFVMRKGLFVVFALLVLWGADIWVEASQLFAVMIWVLAAFTLIVALAIRSDENA